MKFEHPGGTLDRKVVLRAYAKGMQLTVKTYDDGSDPIMDLSFRLGGECRTLTPLATRELAAELIDLAEYMENMTP